MLYYVVLLIGCRIIGCSGSDFFAAPRGVLRDYNEFNVQAKGFIKCYDKPYSHSTVKESFDDCLDSSWVFVGAKVSSATSTFLIGAYGFSTNVFTRTKFINLAYFHNGLYWYMRDGTAFGFSATSNIYLSRTDIETDHNDRLSWAYNVDFGGGGMRAAHHMDLENNNVFRKIVYKLPISDNSPTFSPSVSLPLCTAPNFQYLGDGYCDEPPYNSEECGYDRGDCCELSCVSRDYTCGFNGYNCKQPIDEIPTRHPTIANADPTLFPTLIPSAPTVDPTIAPSAPTLDPTAVPTVLPTTISPTMQPTFRQTSSSVYSFRVDSVFPYSREQDVYTTIEFPNATEPRDFYYYVTTITFSESTKLREDLDYIAIYRDSLKSDVYGEERYTGTHFPGMNGEAALGFRDFRFVFHFHSSDGFIPEDSGYMMSVTITKHSRHEGEDDYGSNTDFAGLSSAGMISILTILSITACIGCCAIPFWYTRAGASAKIVADSREARKDRVKLVREIEDEKIELIRTKKIKNGRKGSLSKYISESNDIEDHGNKKKNYNKNYTPSEPPAEFICSISCDIMKDPVICADGFSYDRFDIEEWLREHDTSPMTNMPLKNKMLIPNRALKEVIENYQKDRGSGSDEAVNKRASSV